MGGRVREIIVGGAPMNQEVTAFLYKIKFPFTIGYGMTECGPLICYDHNNEYVPGTWTLFPQFIHNIQQASESFHFFLFSCHN